MREPGVHTRSRMGDLIGPDVWLKMIKVRLKLGTAVSEQRWHICFVNEIGKANVNGCDKVKHKIAEAFNLGWNSFDVVAVLGGGPYKPECRYQALLRSVRCGIRDHDGAWDRYNPRNYMCKRCKRNDLWYVFCQVEPHLRADMIYSNLPYPGRRQSELLGLCGVPSDWTPNNRQGYPVQR